MRTVSSDSPGGMVSASMSVSNPAWYSLLISESIELLMSLVLGPESRSFRHAVFATARAARDVLSPLDHRAEKLCEKCFFSRTNLRKPLGDRPQHAVVFSNERRVWPGRRRL